MDIQFALSDIGSVAMQLWELTGPGKVIAFHGPMGAGKTTLIHALCDQLKVKGAVGSPTFSLINEYRYGSDGVIYHIDLYRLSDEGEAIRAGVEEAIYSGHSCFVEWPERAPGLFPASTIQLFLDVVDAKTRRCRVMMD